MRREPDCLAEGRHHLAQAFLDPGVLQAPFARRVPPVRVPSGLAAPGQEEERGPAALFHRAPAVPETAYEPPPGT